MKKRNADGAEDGFAELAPVRPSSPNDYGLYDMSGNVFEWRGDFYDWDDYAKSPPADPPGPASGSSRVRRGGSWIYDVVDQRSPVRTDMEPARREDETGFRCARSLPAP